MKVFHPELKRRRQPTHCLQTQKLPQKYQLIFDVAWIKHLTGLKKKRQLIDNCEGRLLFFNTILREGFLGQCPVSGVTVKSEPEPKLTNSFAN